MSEDKETSFKQVLESDGGSKTITYILQMNKEGEIKIPACKASFLDLDKYSGEVNSDAPVVHVGAQTSPEETTLDEGINKNVTPKEKWLARHGTDQRYPNEKYDEV